MLNSEKPQSGALQYLKRIFLVSLAMSTDPLIFEKCRVNKWGKNDKNEKVENNLKLSATQQYKNMKQISQEFLKSINDTYMNNIGHQQYVIDFRIWYPYFLGLVNICKKKFKNFLSLTF